MHKLYFDKIYFVMRKLYFAFQKLSPNSYFSFYKLFFVFHKPSPYSNFNYRVRSSHCVVFGALHGSRPIRRAAG